jgi:hypothetical protein
MANSQLRAWFGLSIGWAFLNHEPITTVGRFAGYSGGVGIMADSSEAKVIYLQSHPAWVAARRRERDRRVAIRRHPSFLARGTGTAAGSDVIRDFKVYSNTDAS